MTRTALLASVVFLAWTGAASAAPARSSTPVEPLEVRAAAGVTAVMRSQCAQADPLLAEVAADARFAAMDAEIRSAVLEGAVVCKAQSDPEAAYALSRRAIQESSATAVGWGLHMALAMNAQRNTEAASAFETMLRTRPTVLADIPDETIAGVYGAMALLPDRDARRLAMLDGLRRAAWKPDDPLDEGEGYSFEHLRLLLKASRAAEAAEVARELKDPALLIMTGIDNRFAPVSRGAPADVRAAVLERARALGARADQHADRMSAALVVAEQHLIAGDSAAALARLDAVLERHARGGPTAFADSESKLALVRALRGVAFDQQGKSREALQALTESANTPVDGQPNSEGRLRLAAYLTDLERGADALTTLSEIPLDTLTEYGKARVAWMRACALAQLNRLPEARQEIERGRKLAPVVDQTALQEAQVCVHDLDGAARSLIARLEDEDERALALLTVQAYRPHPRHTETGRRFDREEAAVIARPDVQAAIRKVGRVQRFDIHRP